jgi:Leucine-rich repeat (LRR) protein
MKELTAFLDRYNIKYTVNGDCVEVSGDLSLESNQLASLPESFGNLKVGGNLYLHNNQLASLPESFGNLKVGGNLYLYNNQLASLPESFGNLKVGGSLYLYNNQLASLPESFGNLKVGGNLYLHNNQLASLPESFGNLKVGGSLSLCYNQLASLPESFGNLKVGGSLYLYNNQLASLPESFGNLKVGGNLYLYNNQLASLPESFGNLKVGGNLYLHNNQLASLPESNRMEGDVLEPGWCFIDGIVREIISRKTVDGLEVIRTPFDYIIGDGSAWAHGETVKEAISDFGFKKLRKDPEELKGYDQDELRSIEDGVNIYRAVTGACRLGVKNWMQGKKLPKKVSIRQIVELTKGAYGSEQFAKFWEISA